MKNAEGFLPPPNPADGTWGHMSHHETAALQAEYYILRNTMAAWHAKNVMSHAGNSCVGECISIDAHATTWTKEEGHQTLFEKYNHREAACREPLQLGLNNPT